MSLSRSSSSPFSFFSRDASSSSSLSGDERPLPLPPPLFFFLLPLFLPGCLLALQRPSAQRKEPLRGRGGTREALYFLTVLLLSLSLSLSRQRCHHGRAHLQRGRHPVAAGGCRGRFSREERGRRPISFTFQSSSKKSHLKYLTSFEAQWVLLLFGSSFFSFQCSSSAGGGTVQSRDIPMVATAAEVREGRENGKKTDGETRWSEKRWEGRRVRRRRSCSASA